MRICNAAGRRAYFHTILRGMGVAVALGIHKPLQGRDYIVIHVADATRERVPDVIH